MVKLGQVPTPDKYVQTLLDSAGYISNIAGKKVLENSCGEGNVLIEIVRRYILDCQRRELPLDDIRNGLMADIIAYDVDENAVYTTIKLLDKLCAEFNIEPVSWNIKCEDYLMQDAGEYDYIIGNPPYITYHDLSVDKRKLLKETFQSCKNGRFDYSYAFIEKSIRDLSENGKLSYLIPFNVFRNKYAKDLREILLTSLCSVINYSGIEVFPNRTIGAAIIVCKNETSNKILYKRPFDNIDKFVKKEDLHHKWIFEGDIPATSKQKFGDYFDVYNSVATLRNSVFLLKEYRCEKDFTIIGDYKIENQLIFDAVSPRSFKLNKRYKIIFPYNVKNDEVKSITEDEFKKNFSYGYNYLLNNKVELEKRDTYSYWYEYGRSQALTSIFKEKLIVSMIVSGRITAYYSGKKEVPYAGYYIVAKTKRFSLKDAARIIESKEFFDYAKCVGTPTTKNSYRLSVDDILQYPLS